MQPLGLTTTQQGIFPGVFFDNRKIVPDQVVRSIDRLQDQAMTCDGNMRAVEEKFVAALKDVRTVQMRAGYLVLSDERGRERLYFARAS